MSQLAFPFAAADPPSARPSRTTRYWRRRIDRAMRRAYELGRRQVQRRPVDYPNSSNLSFLSNNAATTAAKNIAPLPIRKFHPTHEEREELAILAQRVARLMVSHRSPEKFFEDRSELAHAIRQIARRA